MSILALDIGGTPRMWISNDDAISYHATNSVAWSLGQIVVRYRGGVQKNGTQSYLESSSIIAIKGELFNPSKRKEVALTNKTLFGRDRYCCAYCGKIFTNFHELSRDHIVPKSKGGEDKWMNVVASCRSCNSRKGNKTLKESGLELLYLPYVPSHQESMILQNRSILSCQMEFLLQGVPKHSRLLN